MASIPLSEIAKWPTPNYVDPVTWGNEFQWYSGALSIAALGAVCARFYARKVVQKNRLMPDDWIFLCSLPFIVGLVIALNLCTTIYHCNRHIWDLEPAYYEDLAKINWAIYILYLLGSCLLKISVLTFFKRLSSRAVSQLYFYASWAIITFVIVYAVIFTILLLCVCQPFSALWHSLDRQWALTHTYHCLDETPFLLAASIISAVQDLLTALLPLILLSKLKSVKFTQKLGIALLLCSGLVVCAAGFARIVAIYRSGYVTYDDSWDDYETAIIVATEVLLGVLCACAPAYKVCYCHFRGIEQSRAVGSAEYTGNMSLTTDEATKMGASAVTGRGGLSGRTNSSISGESMIGLQNLPSYDVEKQAEMAVFDTSGSSSGSDQEGSDILTPISR